MKHNGKVYHLLLHSLTLDFAHSVITGFILISEQTPIIFINSVKRLIFVMEMCCVLFEVWTECLNII